MGKYKIYNEDIWHQPLVDRENIAKYRTLMKEFDTFEEALIFCRWYLDETFDAISKDEPTKAGFKKYWAFWGEDLFIVPTSDENFSSRDYIQEKINKHYKKQKYEHKIYKSNKKCD